MKRNILIMLLISSLISLSGYGQSLKFTSSGTKFKMGSKYTKQSGDIIISPGVFGTEKESIIEAGKEYTIKANIEYTVKNDFSILDLSNNNLISLDFTGLENLAMLYCQQNKLKSLNVSDLPALVVLSCRGNEELTSLDIRGLKKLRTLYCYDNKFDVCNLDNILSSLPKRDDADNAEIFIANKNGDKAPYNQCKTDITKPKKWKVYDYNGDYDNKQPIKSDQTGCQSYFTFTSSGTMFAIKGSSYYQGDVKIKPSIGDEDETIIDEGDEYVIESNKEYTVKGYFTALDVEENLLTSLDVSGLPYIEELYCENNQLESLDVSELKKLKELYCHDNKFDVCALDDIFESLPQRSDAANGEIFIAKNNGNEDPFNKCKTDITKPKKWKVYDYDGNYNNKKLIVSDQTGCPNSIPENLASELEIKVFPNPVRDALQIESEEVIKQVSIFDISGKLLIKELVNDVNFNLQTADLNSGIYVLRIQTDKGVSNIKVIKE